MGRKGKRDATITPGTGLAQYPSQVMDAIRALDLYFDESSHTATVAVASEKITVSDTGLMQLEFIPNEGSLAVNADAGGGGQAYTIIADETAFGGAGTFEVRLYRGTKKIDCNVSEVTPGTAIYAWYDAVGDVPDARTIAILAQEIIATQTKLDALAVTTDSLFTDTGTAGEALGAEKLGWVDDSGVVMLLSTADLTSLDRVERAVYIESAVTITSTFTFKQLGQVTLPSLLTGVPYGRPLYLGRNGELTWDGDTSVNKLLSGDWKRQVGRYYGDKVKLDLSHRASVTVP